MSKLRSKVVVAVLVLLICGAITSASSAKSVSFPDLKPCLKYKKFKKDHRYEVCYAYYVNSSILSLQFFYWWGRSSNPARVYAATNRLKSRYYEPASSVIEQRVANWPVGKTDTSVPHIDFINISPDLKKNKAELTTKESWVVKNENGEVLYSEVNRIHHIIMRKVKGLFVHKWVVESGV